jgi:hypothetical protein
MAEPVGIGQVFFNAGSARRCGGEVLKKSMTHFSPFLLLPMPSFRPRGEPPLGLTPKSCRHRAHGLRDTPQWISVTLPREHQITKILFICQYRFWPAGKNIAAAARVD